MKERKLKKYQREKYLIHVGGKFFNFFVYYFLFFKKFLIYFNCYRITTSDDLASILASDSAVISVPQEKCNIIKKELQYVLDETNSIVEKLKLASDIHIGNFIPFSCLFHSTYISIITMII